MVYPTPNAETALFVDASSTGCGAVLQQRVQNIWKPLSFFSHLFSSTQQRYATFDRELLAIYLAVRHFRYFVEGRKFAIFTDHAPICTALFTRSQHSSPRQQRHLDYIAQFTSDLRHVKDEENVVADCLSRITASVFEELQPINFLEMAAAKQRDQTIDHLQNNPNSLSLEHRPVPNQGISILGDVSTGNFRPLVPSDLRKKVFESIHCLSHPGIKGSQALISKRYTWPGYKRDIKLWCQTFVTCQQSKIQQHTISPLAGFTPSSQKFQHIHCDIVGPLPVSNDHRYLLTIVDRFSRWFEALPLRDITAKSCADTFVLHFVARYGAPHAITVDRGTQFTSTLWKELTKFLGCELIHTTADLSSVLLSVRTLFILVTLGGRSVVSEQSDVRVEMLFLWWLTFRHSVRTLFQNYFSLLFLTNAGNTLSLYQWFCMTRIHFMLVYNADIKNEVQTHFGY